MTAATIRTHPERAVPLNDPARRTPARLADPLADLTPAQRTACLQALADEYAARYGDTPTVTAERYQRLELALKATDKRGYRPRHASTRPEGKRP
jgi:hypothetical protein